MKQPGSPSSKGSPASPETGRRARLTDEQTGREQPGSQGAGGTAPDPGVECRVVPAGAPSRAAARHSRPTSPLPTRAGAGLRDPRGPGEGTTLYFLVSAPSGTCVPRSCCVSSALPGLGGRVRAREARRWFWEHRVALGLPHAGPGPLRKPFASALPPRAAERHGVSAVPKDKPQTPSLRSVFSPRTRWTTPRGSETERETAEVAEARGLGVLIPRGTVSVGHPPLCARRCHGHVGRSSQTIAVLKALGHKAHMDRHSVWTARTARGKAAEKNVRGRACGVRGAGRACGVPLSGLASR